MLLNMSICSSFVDQVKDRYADLQEVEKAQQLNGKADSYRRSSDAALLFIPQSSISVC